MTEHDRGCYMPVGMETDHRQWGVSTLYANIWGLIICFTRKFSYLGDINKIIRLRPGSKEGSIRQGFQRCIEIGV